MPTLQVSPGELSTAGALKGGGANNLTVNGGVHVHGYTGQNPDKFADEIMTAINRKMREAAGNGALAFAN